MGSLAAHIAEVARLHHPELASSRRWVRRRRGGRLRRTWAAMSSALSADVRGGGPDRRGVRDLGGQGAHRRGRFNGHAAYCWNELHTRGYAQAQDFYARVFGWTYTEIGDGDTFVYSTFALPGGADSIGGINDDTTTPGERPPYWLTWFQVDDADAALTKATELEATIIMGADDSPAGRRAIIAAPQGKSWASSTPPAPSVNSPARDRTREKECPTRTLPRQRGTRARCRTRTGVWRDPTSRRRHMHCTSWCGPRRPEWEGAAGTDYPPHSSNRTRNLTMSDDKYRWSGSQTSPGTEGWAARRGRGHRVRRWCEVDFRCGPTKQQVRSITHRVDAGRSGIRTEWKSSEYSFWSGSSPTSCT